MATEKQKAAARKIIENHRSVSAAMKESGYKSTTATVPGNLTKSKGWQELMDKYYPDDLVAKMQKKLLNAKMFRTYNFDYVLSDKVIKKIISSFGGKLVEIVKYEPTKGKGKNKVTGSKVAYFTVPDQKIVDSAVEMILKTKGRFITKVEMETKRQYGDLTDEQLRRIANGESIDSV